MDLNVNENGKDGVRDVRSEGKAERCSCPICGSVLPVNDIVFRDRLVVANGAVIQLTNAETAIFDVLLKGFPGFVARERVYHALVSWRFTEADWPTEKTVDAHICHMRRKLDKVGLKIETSYGFGYRLASGVRVMEAAE